MVVFVDDNLYLVVVSILRQISIENLNRIMNMIDIHDEIKVYAFKERAEYLENRHQMKHVA